MEIKYYNIEAIFKANYNDNLMPKKAIIEDAVSIVPVRDVIKTVSFYVDILQFEKRFISESEDFAIVVHGKAAIHFVKTDSESALKATANYISIYLWVKNIEILYEQLKPKLDMLPKHQLRPLFVQEYGMKEFHIKDPNGCALLFGEDIE